jgi:glycosyltransferase involved in cell wall biosynthesis
MKKKLLALYYRPPELNLPQNSYGQYHILQAAKEVFETRILSFRSPSSIKQDENYFEPNYSYSNKVFNLALRGKSPHLTHYFTREMFKAYKDSLNDFKPDLLYVDNLLMMQYPLTYRSKSKIWFYDDESQIYVKGNGLRKNLLEQIRNIGLSGYEQKAISISDKTFCITDEETNYLKSLGFKSIKTLPYPVDDEYFYYNWNLPKDEFSILFIGDFSHYPNKEAAKIICTKIYPTLKELKIKFILVGRNFNNIKSYLNDGISIFENTEDIRPFYWNSSLFIAPIFSGGGMRIKILEAAACGIPVLMTPASNIGINFEESKEVFLADTINEFIEAISRIYNSDSSAFMRMSNNANQKVKSLFALDQMKRYYKKVFTQ